MKINNIFLGTLAVGIMFNGCSSYRLQDYADKYFDQKPSEKQESVDNIQKVKTDKYDSIWKEFDKSANIETSDKDYETNKNSDLDVNAVHAEVIGATSAKYDNLHNALQSISPTPTYDESKRVGLLQSTYDEFIKDEWTPDVEDDEEITKEYGNEERSFTLQEYVDKWGKYLEKHKTSIEESHVEKVNDMPVIGK